MNPRFIKGGFKHEVQLWINELSHHDIENRKFLVFRDRLGLPKSPRLKTNWYKSFAIATLDCLNSRKNEQLSPASINNDLWIEKLFDSRLIRVECGFWIHQAK